MTKAVEESWVPARWRGKSSAALWRNMLIKDHGLVKVTVPNRHRVTDAFFRSAQPLPYQLAAFKRRGGRSVVNLRGQTKYATYVVTRRACEKLGLAFHDFRLRSRDVPHREELSGLLDLFDRLDYPALFYCKSGADRSGLVAGLYLIHCEGRGAEEAARALNWRYMHVKSAKTGILGRVIEDYAAYRAATGGDLRRFAETAYDPDAIRESFRPSGPWGWIAEKILRRE